MTTVYLVHQSKIYAEVNTTIESFKNSLSSRILSFINYFRIVIQSNNIITALNTNVIFAVSPYNGNIVSLLFFANYYLMHDGLFEVFNCGTRYFTRPATLTFYSPQWYILARISYFPSSFFPNSTNVNGFFTGCSPLEALLNSTLDCLYEIDCLQLLRNFFPTIQQVLFHNVLYTFEILFFFFT